MTHPHIPHPYAALKNASTGFHDRFLSWVSNRVLASAFMFDTALIVPLLALPASDTIKLIVGVFSGSWIQWWSLSAIQRTQIRADEKRDAKAEADHQAQTHMATVLDEVRALLTSHLRNGRES